MMQRSQRSAYAAKWDQLSTFDKVLTYTKEHKVAVVAGSWAGSMAISWLYIRMQPMTVAQRLVQARMWAQGLTIASLIGMAAITQIPSKGDALIEEQHAQQMSSWEQVIAANGQNKSHDHPEGSRTIHRHHS